MTTSATKGLRLRTTALCVIVAAALGGCGDEPGTTIDPDAETGGVSSPFAHIKPQPPGGKWIAQARNKQNFVREFKGTGTVYLVGVSLARLVSIAYGGELSEVKLAKKHNNAHYDAVVRPNDKSPETARKMLQSLWVIL